MTKKIWKPIKDHSNYKASNHGDILNIEKDKMIKPTTRKDDTRIIKHFKKDDGTEHEAVVARLIYQTFGKEKLTDKLSIKYDDDKKDNLHIDNLKVEPKSTGKHNRKKCFEPPKKIDDATFSLPNRPEDEKWKTVKGFEYHKISNYGKVVSFKSKDMTIQEPSKKGGDCLYVRLFSSEKTDEKGLPIRVEKSVKKLVFEHFGNEPIDEKKIVISEDGVKDNTHISNLKQETRSEINKNRKKREKLIDPIHQFDENDKLIKTWNNIDDIQKEKGYDKEKIISCYKGESDFEYNCKWVRGRYIKDTIEFVSLVPIDSYVFSKYKINKEGDIIGPRNIIYTAHPAANGYKIVSLNSDCGTDRIVKNHIAVANTFIEKIEGKDYVNHINENKLDNRVENLEWTTLQENTIHSCGIGISATDEKTKKVKKFKSKADAARSVGLKRWNTVLTRVLDTEDSAYGYIWKKI